MLEELKAAAYAANLKLTDYKLISLTFGNASVLDRDRGILAIKPSGVPYEALLPSDMVLVDIEGNKVEGKLNPSSDTPTHAALYRAFAGVRGVVHTHSKFATAFAQAGMPIPCYGTTHADYCRDAIPVTRAMTTQEIQGAYELETGNVLIERFHGLDPLDYPGALVHSHAPFAWAEGGMKAVENAFAMELIAEMAYHTRQINPAATAIGHDLHYKHFHRKHGANAYYGQASQPAAD